MIEHSTSRRRDASDADADDFAYLTDRSAASGGADAQVLELMLQGVQFAPAADPFRVSLLRRFLRQQSVRWFTLLAISEFLLLNLAVWASVEVRFWGQTDGLAPALDSLPLRAPLFALCIMISLIAVGLYQRHSRERFFGTMIRLLVAFACGAVALMVLYYALPEVYAGRGVLGLSLGFGLVTLALFRAVFFRVIDDEALRRRVLVLGAGRRAGTIHRRMRRRIDQRSITLLGYVPMPGESPTVPTECLVERNGSLVDFAREHELDEIVVGPDDRRQALPMAELLACRLAGIDVTELSDFFERESGKVKLDLVTPSSLVFSDGFKSSLLRHYTKRFSDVLAALLILSLFWPMMLITALAIWLEAGGRGPILYRQERVGRGGATFQLIKFRSMRTDAEQDGVARWAMKNDDRVTQVGRVIRATRLDELPQLWNVLKGEMSLVGPRPERPQFVDQLVQRIPYYNLRHCVKPGLAGWAQLRYPYGASELDAMEKLKFDLYYAKNHDLRFDLMVLLQTVEVVLFRRGVR